MSAIEGDELAPVGSERSPVERGEVREVGEGLEVARGEVQRAKVIAVVGRPPEGVAEHAEAGELQMALLATGSGSELPGGGIEAWSVLELVIGAALDAEACSERKRG